MRRTTITIYSGKDCRAERERRGLTLAEVGAALGVSRMAACKREHSAEVSAASFRVYKAACAQAALAKRHKPSPSQ